MASRPRRLLVRLVVSREGGKEWARGVRPGALESGGAQADLVEAASKPRRRSRVPGRLCSAVAARRNSAIRAPLSSGALTRRGFEKRRGSDAAALFLHARGSPARVLRKLLD